MSTRKLFAVALAAVMLLSVFALPGAAAASASTGASITDGDDENASIDVTEDGAKYTVTVTDNGTAVNETTVNVTVKDENVSYDDAGEHTTDNGTFALGAPDNETVNVTLEATVVDEDVTETEELEPLEDDDAEPENFGALVSSFVEEADDDGPLGLQVAGFVLNHDDHPGNVPGQAGPPGVDDDDRQGPSENAGGSSAGDDENGGGPPEDAGGPGN